MKLLLQKRIVLLLIVLGVALWLWGITYPFVGIYNTNNNYLSLAAKNYLRFGFWNLKLFPTYFAGAHFMPGNPYYLHHPILIFWLEALSVFVFGSHNWSIHVPQLVFTAGGMAMIYVIARKLWNQKVALWSLGLAVIFPMTGFFWKYMLFEQASLFLNLAVYYFLIRYSNRPNSRDLIAIFFATVLSGFVDWGVLYLLLPFALFFFTRFGKRIKPAFIAYVSGAVLSLGLFLVGVLLSQKGFGELSLAIWGRSFTAELTGLSYWPARLLAISIIRTILYFSPFAIVSGLYIVKLIKNRESWKLPDITLVFFFLFGLLNLIFLPTATWGHSYFLYYFIPFFAWAGGVWLERREKKPWVVFFWVFIIIGTSIAVNYFKIQQVKKQLWKYDVAKEINKKLEPYETIGVVNFAGDVFENYFFHPSQPIAYTELSSWTKGVVYPGVINAVFVCAGPCTAGELQTVEQLQGCSTVEPYTVDGNTAWFLTRQLPMPGAGTARPTHPVLVATKKDSIFLRIYRTIRDALNVGQI
jgi:4-amino-4-deoxy-L-arabinose transferase-like glycosyltransferase